MVSLYEFVKSIWHILEPENPYVDNWHIENICVYLEAVTTFTIPRLLINMPPRMLKSIIVTVAWPAWVWLSFPDRRFLFASYAQSLSTRDSIKMRTVIENAFYRRLVKGKWQLTDDQNQKMRYDNTMRGFRFATSVGGMVTGEGGDYLVCDDPHHALEVHSDVQRKSVLEWYDKVFSTRANNPKKVGRVIVMQRLHAKDLTGHLLEKGNWEQLVLPMHYSKKTVSVSRLVKTVVDPRKIEGELLFPERFGKKEIDDLERDLGENAHAQLDQAPAPADGGIIKRPWWKTYSVIPKDKIGLFMFIDCASKPGISNDHTCISVWLETLSGYYILEVKQAKVDWDDLVTMTKNMYGKYRPHEVIVEDKSAGIQLIQTLKKKTTIPVTPYNPLVSKELRAIAAAPTIKAGNVYLPTGGIWCEDFITEHESFPNSEHDDQVDTTSMAIAYFNERIIIVPRMTSL